MPTQIFDHPAAQTTMERINVRFASGDDICDAWLYLPCGASKENKAPVIVMAHGLGGEKTVRLGAYAERFCGEGFACLVFDYRFFGDSSGEPRYLLDIPSQLDDWRAAIAFARSRDEIDAEKVIVWGTSFAGGHVIVTASDDRRVLAAIAQCPFTDGLASGTTIDWGNTLKITFRAFRDLLAKVLNRPSVRVPTAGAPGETALMNSADALEGTNALNAASGRDNNPVLVPARIALQIVRHRPGKLASKVLCPILFCVCEHDTVAPAKPTLGYAAQAPKGEVRLYPVGHFDIYLGEAFERVVRDQIGFLKTHLQALD